MNQIKFIEIKRIILQQYAFLCQRPPSDENTKEKIYLNMKLNQLY